MVEDRSKLSRSWLMKNASWQILLLAIFLLVAGTTQEDFNSYLNRLLPETMPFCSSYNNRGSGYKAFFELCQKVGFATKRWARSYRDLRSERGCLIIVAPKYPLKDHDVKQILAWVSQGNDLIYFDYFGFRAGQKMLDSLGLNREEGKAKYLLDARLLSDSQNPFMENVKSFSITASERITGGKSLLTDEDGAVIVETEYGRGRCLVASAPSLCANIRIRDESSKGNFQFLVNWLGRKQILFEEKSHGYTAVENVFSHLARSPVGYVCFQLGIIFFVALFSLNQRFGPAATIETPRKISNKKFIEGLALAYAKAKAYDTAWLILFSSLKARLCKALGISPSDPNSVLAGAWAEATGLSGDELQNFLAHGVQLMDKGKMTQEELLAGVALCDRYMDKSKEFIAVGNARRLGS